MSTQSSFHYKNNVWFYNKSLHISAWKVFIRRKYDKIHKKEAVYVYFWKDIVSLQDSFWRVNQNKISSEWFEIV